MPGGGLFSSALNTKAANSDQYVFFMDVLVLCYVMHFTEISFSYSLKQQTRQPAVAIVLKQLVDLLK